MCPFGLSCSPNYFYKVLRPVITYLRSLCIRVSVFVDDVLLADVAASITDSTDFLLHTLSDLGFTINFEKSHLSHTNTIKYLSILYLVTGVNFLLKLRVRVFLSWKPRFVKLSSLVQY